MTTVPTPAPPPMPARGWMALGGAAVLVSAVIIGVLAAVPTPPTSGPVPPPVASMAQPATTASLPDLGGPRSLLVPEMTLPVGARPYVGKEPVMPGFEFWEVPASHQDLVAQMRSELPTYASLNAGYVE